MVESISGLQGLNKTKFVTAKDKNSIDKDGFMKLLLTQLRHQDPMSPLESHELASQLAQFTSVEQLFNINEKLDRNLEVEYNLNQAIGNSLSTTIVGKDLRAIGNELYVGEEGTSDIIYELSESAANISISIYDSTGNLVRTDILGKERAGTHIYNWDGKDDHGNKIADGIYTFSVSATNPQGTELPVSTFMGGHISGVLFGDNGNTEFLVGGLRISVADVVRIDEPKDD